MSRVKNENYIQISGWMINRLKLKGNELLVFAIIFGFSQKEGQYLTGSLQYLADWTNSTRHGIRKNLNSLVLKKLIIKEEVFVGKAIYHKYKHSEFSEKIICEKSKQILKIDSKQSCTPTGKQSYTGGKQSCTPTGKQSLPNNTILNKSNNTTIYTNQKKEKTSKTDTEIEKMFLKFYEKYPLKKSKAQALKIFTKIFKKEKDKNKLFDDIINGLTLYIKQIEFLKTEQKFIKHPSSFLNKRSWEDDFITNKKKDIKDDEPLY